MTVEVALLFAQEGNSENGSVVISDDSSHTTTVSFPPTVKAVPVQSIVCGAEFAFKGRGGRPTDELVAHVSSVAKSLQEKQTAVVVLYGPHEALQQQAYWTLLTQLMETTPDIATVESWATCFAIDNSDKVVLYDLTKSSEHQAYMEETAKEGTTIVGLSKHQGKADVATMKSVFQAAVEEVKSDDGYIPMHSLTTIETNKEQRIAIYLMATSKRPIFAATMTTLQMKYEATQRQNGGIIACANSLRYQRRRIPFLACKCTAVLRHLFVGDETKLLFVAAVGANETEEAMHTANAVNRIRANGMLNRMLSRHVELERWRVSLDTHLLETHLAIVQKAYKHVPVVFGVGLQDDLLEVTESTIDKLKKKQQANELKHHEEDKERIAAIVNDYNTAKQKELEEESRLLEGLKRKIQELESDLEDVKLMKDPGSSQQKAKQRVNQLVDELPVLRDQVATREAEIKRLRATTKNVQPSNESIAFKTTSAAEQESIRRKIALTKIKNSRQVQSWQRQIAAYDERLPHALNRASAHVQSLIAKLGKPAGDEVPSFQDAVGYAKETIASFASIATNLLPPCPTVEKLSAISDSRSAAAALIDQHRSYFVSEYSKLVANNSDVATFKFTVTFVGLAGIQPSERSAQADYRVTINHLGKEVSSPAAKLDSETRQVKWMFPTTFDAQLQKQQDGSWSRTPLILTVIETEAAKRDFIPWELDLGVLVDKAPQAYALSFDKLHLKIHVASELVRTDKHSLRIGATAAEKDRRTRNPLWQPHFHPFLSAPSASDYHVDPTVA